MRHVEYKEVRIPEEILAKLEKGAEAGQPVTLGDAGVFDWLNKQAKDEGWRVVWQVFHFPFVVLEREVGKD